MEITYFESGGKEHTDSTLKIAKDYAEKNKIKSIVVASTTGFTAEKAAEVFKGKDLVIVTHEAGFAGKDTQQFPENLRKKLESKGVKFVTAAHTFGGTNKLVENSVGSIIAETLRMFSQGMKVAVEIAAEATDAGLVKTNEEIISIAGTGRGADNALVVKPANSRNLFDMKIRKILAKPL